MLCIHGRSPLLLREVLTYIAALSPRQQQALRFASTAASSSCHRHGPSQQLPLQTHSFGLSSASG